MLKLLLLIFISQDKQTALLIEFLPVSSTSAFSLPKLFDAEHLYSPKCSLLTFCMIKVWSVPLLSIRKLLSFSNRSDFRYHLKESHLIIDLCCWCDFLTEYSFEISSPSLPHISRGIGCDNTGETGHVAYTRVDCDQLRCHFRTVWDKKSEYSDDCSNIQIKPLYVILSVILQAHNITIKHIRGCKSFTAAKIINPTTWVVEYQSFKVLFIFLIRLQLFMIWKENIRRTSLCIDYLFKQILTVFPLKCKYFMFKTKANISASTIYSMLYLRFEQIY